MKVRVRLDGIKDNEVYRARVLFTKPVIYKWLQIKRREAVENDVLLLFVFLPQAAEL